MTEWHNSTEEIPQEGEYLVYQTPDHKDFHIGVSYYKTGYGWNYGYYVYYWAELPEPPQMETPA